MMGGEFNVLISSSGRRVALLHAFRSSLAEMGMESRVDTADMSARSSALHLGDRRYRVPPCSSPDFVPSLVEICQANSIHLVIPTIDTELAAYAEHRSEFRAVETAVAVSGPETIAICADKRRTHEGLVANNLPTVRQGSPKDVIQARGSWTFPLIAKPATGSASEGIRRIESSADLDELVERSDYVVQEIAEGKEFTVDVFVDAAGRSRCAVPRQRLEVRSGEVSKAVTVRLSSIEDLASRLCERLPESFGVITVQIFHDRETNQARVIEINPRFGGGFPLAYEAGADYPSWLVEETLGLESSASHDCWREGLVMLRYDDAVFVQADEVDLE